MTSYVFAYSFLPISLIEAAPGLPIIKCLAFGIGIPLVMGVGYATVHLRDLETPTSSYPPSSRHELQVLPILSRGLQQNYRALEGFTVLRH